MSLSLLTPEEQYATLVDALLGSEGVTVGISGKKGFGSSGLAVNNRIFAMLSKGRLVVKLPKQRVDALVAAGEGVHFDPGHGRLMKEWLAIEPGSAESWLTLAREALEFVAAAR